jgi:hypothetical protein
MFNHALSLKVVLFTAAATTTFVTSVVPQGHHFNPTFSRILFIPPPPQSGPA